VSVSYFEWVQDRQGYFWSEKDVNQKLAEIMTNAFESVVNYADSHKVNNRIAAYMLAMDRVAQTIKLRGIYG
jgi:glutamate dehydrogenase (NAD(P)+)